MRTIKISDAVWDAIAAKGKFGESEDDVLRRVFDIEEDPEGHESLSGKRGRGGVRYAKKRMSARVEGGELVIEFEDGAKKSWTLPDKEDKSAIRQTREAAVAFALDNGASDPGQTNAVRKAITDAGYYISR